MRWTDLCEQTAPFLIKATKRFKKDYQDFIKKWPEFEEIFTQFLKAKIADPRAPFGQKDKPFMDSKNLGLRGWNHAHMIYGKVILTYKVQQNVITLAAVTDHLSVEGVGPRIRALGAYLNSVDTSSVDPFQGVSTSSQPESTQSDLHKPTVMDLFYEMAAHESDRNILIQFVKGENDHVLEFLALLDPPITPAQVPLSQLKAWAGQVLQQTSQHL
jgi:mRNA-degrading endonuclease YafQ of YafQ-DinJ toxin-antitoxin module